MDNVKEITVTGFGGQEEIHVIIDRGNGEYTSMPKAVWDEQQAQQTQGGIN